MSRTNLKMKPLVIGMYLHINVIQVSGILFWGMGYHGTFLAYYVSWYIYFYIEGAVFIII